MALKIEGLLRNFLKSRGQALYLVPSECTFMMLDGARVEVTREPLSQDTFKAVATELVPGRDLLELVRARHKFRLSIPGVEATEVCFHARGSKPAIMFRRLATPAPAPAPAPVPAPAPAAVRPAPEPPKPAAPVAKAVEPIELLADDGPSTPAPAEPAPARPPLDMSLPPDDTQLEIELSQGRLSEKPAGAPAPALSSSAGSAAAPEVGIPTEFGDVSADDVKPLEQILKQALELGATDVHVASLSVPFARVGGELQPLSGWNPFTPKQVEASLTALLPENQQGDLARAKDRVLVIATLSGQRYRASVWRDQKGLGVAFRPLLRKLPTARELGVPAAALKLLELRRGLVILAGAPGAGKTTTLASLMPQLTSTRQRRIVVLERPLEFTHADHDSLVHQREVGTHTESFASGLRAALAQDTDAIVLGDIGDPEVASLALEAAQTRLVVAALNAASAMMAIELLTGLLGGSGALAATLSGVLVQALCARKAGGWIPAFELLLVNEASAELIRDRKLALLPAAIQATRKSGACSLSDSLVELARRGVVTPAEALARAFDRQALSESFRAAGLALPAES